MDRLKQKITSQSGASITYALLLFLVCAVVSAIVLAAGTAASGRISGSVSHDQRYYSVTSACKMFIDLFDKTTVTSQKTITTTTIGETITESTSYTAPVVTKGGVIISETANYSLLTLAAKLYTGTAESSDPASFPENMDVKIDGTKNASICASFAATEDQADSGRITLAVSSYDEEASEEDEDEDRDAYTLYLVFDANIEEVEDSSTKDTSSGGSTVTDTTTTEMTWTLTSMSTMAP